MCGRFTLTSTPQRLRERFALAAAPEDVVPRYNIAPSQDVLVVPNRAQRLLRPARWGLVPWWSKTPSGGNRMINARVETLAAAGGVPRAARAPALRSSRPTASTSGSASTRRRGRPSTCAAATAQPLAFAGLWDVWRDPQGEKLASCTIITVPANDAVSPIHDRMPAILSDAALDAWLDPAPTPALQLTPWLEPSPDDWLDAYPVSSWVNTPDHDDPQCIAPVETPVT